jgi:very-short-patch-repair endonuclease
MDKIRTRARELRKNATDVERVLWRHLRLWQLNGHKFRRQQPLGHYIVDFVCLKKKLIIEVDGGQHADNRSYDAKRDEWLRHGGFSIIRLWNTDILKNIDGVKALILKALETAPTSILPHKGEGRRSAKVIADRAHNQSI